MQFTRVIISLCILASASSAGGQQPARFAPTTAPAAITQPFFTKGFLLKGSGNTSAAYDACLADVNGDGWLDLMIVHGGSVPVMKDGKPYGSGTNMLFLHNGTAKPFEGVSYQMLPNPCRDTRTCALGDINGDGKPDYVLGGANGTHGMHEISVSYNNGKPNPFDSEKAICDKAQTRGLAIIDVNGDGKNDIVAGWGTNSASTQLFLNNGDGAFTQKEIGPEDKWPTSAIRVVDINGDGKPDVITCGGNTPEIPRLYLNNGTADPFKGVCGQNIGSVKRSSYQFDAADFNGDGKVDIVFAGRKGVSVYYNTGKPDAPFATTGEGELVGDDARSCNMATAGDVDGDGRADVILAESLDGGVPRQPLLFINNGTAAPFKGVNPLPLYDTRETDLGGRGWSVRTIILNDINKDGKIDLFVVHKWGGTELFLNNHKPRRKAGGGPKSAAAAPGVKD